MSSPMRIVTWLNLFAILQGHNIVWDVYENQIKLQKNKNNPSRRSISRHQQNGSDSWTMYKKKRIKATK